MPKRPSPRLPVEPRASHSSARWAAACLLAWLAQPSPALAERADRDKPIQADADKLTLDNAQKVSVFDGNVVIVQGTMRITADRVVLREDKDGYRHATGTGTPGRQTTFRQKRDDADEYVDGTSDRFEYDAHTDRLELFGRANLRRASDDVRGEYISYDTRTEFFRVNGNGGGTTGTSPAGGRVHVTIQPQTSGSANGGDKPAAPLDLKRDNGAAARP